MTTVLNLRHALVIVVTLAVYAGCAALEVPRWLTYLLAGLACAAALAAPNLIQRLRNRREATPAADPRALARELARRLRLLADDRESGERGLHCVVACPGADVANLLGPAGFARETLANPGGPTWALWRRRGSLCLELPAAYLDETHDDAWHTMLATMPRRLLRAWLRGAVVVARWDALAASDAPTVDRWAELVRDRLRAWARHVGLSLPVHVVVTSTGDPLLAPLFAPPLKLDRGPAWGFQLPPMRDAGDCERLAASELTALADALASRIVQSLGDSEDVLPEAPPPARTLLPLIPRIRGLIDPGSRLLGALLAGSPQLQTLWPRGLFLTSEAPPGFLDGLFTGVLTDDAAHVRPHRGSERQRRRLLVAAGLAVSACTGLVGALALIAYRDNQAALATVHEHLKQRMPITSGPGAPAALADLSTLIASLDELAWPGPLAILATATELRSPLQSLHGISVHNAVLLPTLARARDRLCPTHAAALTDADAPAFAAMLDLYVLATWTRTQTRAGTRNAAELAVDQDDDRRDAVIDAGVAVVWADDPRLPATTRDAIAALLRKHMPIVISSQRLRPHREDSCVAQAQARLKQWRDTTCIVAALAPLYPESQTLRGLIQSRHFEAIARPDEQQIASLYTAPRFAEIERRFAEPDLRCGLGGFASGVSRTDDHDAAVARRRTLMDQYTTDYIDAWDSLLAGLAPKPPERGCVGLPTLLHQMSSSEGPLRKLPDLVTHHALPAASSEPTPWTAQSRAKLHAALDPYTEPSRIPGDSGKPAIEGILHGIDRLKVLLEPGAGNRRAEADRTYAEARDLLENACSVLDPRSASLLRGLVKPLYEQTFRCVDADSQGPPDPWCAEVAGPFARGLGDAYPFVADARREVQLPDLCQFYCPQKGAAWKYYDQHLASVLFAAGDGRFTANNDPGFVSFRPYNPALAPFYARTWRLSNLLFPFGDAADPSIRAAVYIPPIDQPDVEVAEIRLVVDGQTLEFTNARPLWLDLAWPGKDAPAKAGATLHIIGRYHDEPFAEELQERGVWGLFRLLERATEARWVDDHLRFTFTFAALHGLSVTIELDAGIANELFLARDGKPMAAFRSPQVAPPLQLRRRGPSCPS